MRKSKFMGDSPILSWFCFPLTKRTNGKEFYLPLTLLMMMTFIFPQSVMNLPFLCLSSYAYKGGRNKLIPSSHKNKRKSWMGGTFDECIVSNIILCHRFFLLSKTGKEENEDTPDR